MCTRNRCPMVVQSTPVTAPNCACPVVVATYQRNSNKSYLYWDAGASITAICKVWARQWTVQFASEEHYYYWAIHLHHLPALSYFLCRGQRNTTTNCLVGWTAIIVTKIHLQQPYSVPDQFAFYGVMLFFTVTYNLMAEYVSMAGIQRGTGFQQHSNGASTQVLSLQP